MDVTIVVATFGHSSRWLQSGNDTAATMSFMFDYPVVRLHSHDGTLASVRNTGAALAQTEWLCFLDAGDTLDVDYFDEMEVEGDLLAPRLIFSSGNKRSESEPFDLTQRDMAEGNPCAIGTLIRKDMFDSVGGFWEEPAYEDWSLFRRAWLKGAKITHTNAKYYALDAPGSRNKTVADPITLIQSIKESHDRWLA